MIPSGSFSGAGLMTRRFRIGATIVDQQITCIDTTAGRLGTILDPATVNDYTEAVGVALEGGTYTTTQGTGSSTANVMVKSTFSPLQLVRGRLNGGVTADTAFVEATDGNLLTNTSASAGGTVITDADVGTSEYVGGYAIALTGQNAGQVRIITSHSDNTSTTVTVPFDYAIAVGDTFLRTFAIGNQGLELTTSYTQFNSRTGAAVDIPDTGSGIIVDVWIDGTTVEGFNGQASIVSTTAPYAEAVIVFADHAFNSLA